MFWDFYWSSSALHLWCTCFQVNTLTWQKSLTAQSSNLWIVRNRGFWELQQGCSDLHLWHNRCCEQVNKLTLQKSLTRRSWDWWIVMHWVSWDLHWGSRDLHLKFPGTCFQVNKLILQVTYLKKSRKIYCKALSFLRPSSKIPWQLFSSQQTHFTKVTHPEKHIFRDLKKLTLLTPSLRHFRP